MDQLFLRLPLFSSCDNTEAAKLLDSTCVAFFPFSTRDAKEDILSEDCFFGLFLVLDVDFL